MKISEVENLDHDGLHRWKKTALEPVSAGRVSTNMMLFVEFFSLKQALSRKLPYHHASYRITFCGMQTTAAFALTLIALYTFSCGGLRCWRPSRVSTSFSRSADCFVGFGFRLIVPGSAPCRHCQLGRRSHCARHEPGHLPLNRQAALQISASDQTDASPAA